MAESGWYSDVGSKYGPLNQDDVFVETIPLKGGNEVRVALVMVRACRV
jgi:hypothetical protein